MKVLIALPYFPFPPKDGGLKAAYYMIDYLRNFFEITVICPYAESDKVSALNEKWGNVRLIIATIGDPVPSAQNLMYIPRRSLKNKLKRKIKIFLSGTNKLNITVANPIEICNDIRKSNMLLYRRNFLVDDRAFLNKFHEIVHNEYFSIIQIEFAILMGLVNCVSVKGKIIFVHHELMFKVIEREMQTIEFVDEYDNYLYKNIKEQELSLLAKYDNIIALSEQDKAFLKNNNIFEEKIFVSPFSIPIISEDDNVNTPFLFDDKIIFIGSDSHNPNLDAVYWFITDILPLILKKFSKITFYVIGKWNKELVDSLKGFTQVIFTGYLENVQEFIKGAVMVVPIRFGSGLRTKIFEGVNWKIPIITTTIGVEGIPLKDGVDCFIADEPEHFVEKLGLLYDAKYVNKIIQNAYSGLSVFADLNRCGELRKNIYKRIIENETLFGNN